MHDSSTESMSSFVAYESVGVARLSNHVGVDTICGMSDVRSIGRRTAWALSTLSPSVPPGDIRPLDRWHGLFCFARKS